MANFHTRLEQRIAQCGNPVCLGMDPVLKLIPLEGSAEEKIKRFYLDILECALKRNVTPAVVKPNSAYYECVSVQAMLVLQELIAAYRSAGIPVILDAKRGDIGKSSAAYANAAYDVYGADAVTVSPWMGAWDGSLGYLGAVVGATHPEELEQITAYTVAKKHEIPFLIPGVSIPGVPGGQGGDAKTVLTAIANGGGKRKFHVLNSSSGLNFAWQRNNTPANFANDCIDALEKLAEACNF